MGNITTIKLKQSTKSTLDHIKYKSESYDVAIQRLIFITRNANLKSDLIEAYKNMGKKELQFFEDWEQASNEVEDYG